VIVEERKLAGVLVEVLADRRHVIGIGLNSNNTLAEAPPELHSTATTLRDLTGRHQDQTALLIGLLQGLERCLSELRRDRRALAARADALCLQRGRRLTLTICKETVSGTCDGIAEDGALLLETSSGSRRFYTGVVNAVEKFV